MNIKHSIVALGAAGATAALVFGGSAVSTAFTSQSPTQTDSFSGAKTGITVDRGNFTVEKLVPGDAAQSAGTVTITNTSDVPAVLSLTLGTPQVVSDGTGGAPDLSKLEVSIDGHPGNLGQAGGLANHPFNIASLDPGKSRTLPIEVSLSKGTGNDWNGAKVVETWTATMTAGN